MIIIVEGIDRVGKTTLVNKLQKEFNYPVFKDLPKYYNLDFKNKEINTSKLDLLVNLFETKIIKDVILDRGHFTEYVYGLINRKYNNEYIEDIDNRLSKLDNIIMVYVKPEDLARSIKEHGSDLTENNKLMDECIIHSKIKNIITVSYSYLDNAITLLKTLIQIKDK